MQERDEAKNAKERGKLVAIELQSLAQTWVRWRSLKVRGHLERLLQPFRIYHF